MEEAIVVNHHCLVCGTDSLANYVDMTLVISRTTLVREKLKTVLHDKWIPTDTEMSMGICLPSFHLVDQLDVLESQIQNIRDNLATEYVGTNGIKKQKSPEFSHQQHQLQVILIVVMMTEHHLQLLLQPLQRPQKETGDTAVCSSNEK
jgi:hypothetical protein